MKDPNTTDEQSDFLPAPPLSSIARLWEMLSSTGRRAYSALAVAIESVPGGVLPTLSLHCQRLALTLMWVASAVHISEVPIHAQMYNGLRYTTANGIVTITGYDCGAGQVVEIPSAINGMPVVNITGDAFVGCASITSISIPNTVKSIPNYAFSNCSGLTYVSVPNSISSLPGNAFLNCYSLTNITVDPTSVFYRSIDGVVFNKNATTLVRCPPGLGGSYSIPVGVTRVEGEAFYSCIRLESIILPWTVTSIGSWAFAHCSFSSIIIPNSVTSFGLSAFRQCENLVSIDIPNSVKVVSDSAFLGCRNLSNVNIPSSVTTIEAWAFYGCSINGVALPNSLTTIGPFAFQQCIWLSSVTIPRSVKNIHKTAFQECLTLKSVYCSGDAPAGEWAASLDSSAIIYYIPGTTGWASLSAPAGVKVLPFPNAVLPVATAAAQVVNGFVVGVTVANGGGGYTNPPTVSITGGGGVGASAIASIVNGVVSAITIKNPGSGYTSTPLITIAPPTLPPRKAIATSFVVNGFVVGATVNDGGFGYSEAPAVLLVGGGGMGATGVATMVNGVVTGVVITNPGSGYTSAPSVKIGSPGASPKLRMAVSRVKVFMDVMLGRRYLLESSNDLVSWTGTGSTFTAQDEKLEQEFEVSTSGAYFRLRLVP